MIKQRVSVLVALMVVLCIGAAPALAEEPWQPYALAGGQAVGGVLAGDAVGSFNYYRVSYPGNSTDVRIQLSVSSYDAVLAHTVGFNVYGPDGRVDTGDWKADEGYLEVTYQEEAPAELVVQVYNYGSSPISYSIVATGLPEATATTETAAPATTDSAVTTSATTATPTTPTTVGGQGTLLGNTGGAAALYTVAYAGDSVDRIVTLTYGPGDTCFGSAFGINIYAPDGSLAAQGTHTDQYNVIQATLNSTAAGDYTVQVFNYTDGITLYYTLEVAE